MRLQKEAAAQKLREAGVRAYDNGPEVDVVLTRAVQIAGAAAADGGSGGGHGPNAAIAWGRGTGYGFDDAGGNGAEVRLAHGCLRGVARRLRVLVVWQEDPGASSRLAEKVLLQNSHTVTLMATLRVFVSMFGGAEHLFAPVLEVLHASCLVPYVQSCLRTSEMDMLANLELYRSVRRARARCAVVTASNAAFAQVHVVIEALARCGPAVALLDKLPELGNSIHELLKVQAQLAADYLAYEDAPEQAAPTAGGALAGGGAAATAGAATVAASSGHGVTPHAAPSAAATTASAAGDGAAVVAAAAAPAVGLPSSGKAATAAAVHAAAAAAAAHAAAAAAAQKSRAPAAGHDASKESAFMASLHATWLEVDSRVVAFRTRSAAAARVVDVVAPAASDDIAAIYINTLRPLLMDGMVISLDGYHYHAQVAADKDKVRWWTRDRARRTRDA